MSDPAAPRSNRPLVETCAAGRYAWCTCNRSSRHPHCDGSHKGSDFKPMIVELEEEKKVAWCACGRTATAPWCDGSHKEG
ncbi:MAG: CDGSH iron-sulfur domain-containing protein [Planctomycetota bacterium]|nr:MAG: CDGSH iron-sulfur domain-containing protein [Planctomycetota bacterium]